MPWLPDGIPPVSNAKIDINTLSLYAPYLSSDDAKVQCDDLTFIIPIAFDSYTRLNNLNLCLLWIMRNTTAKVIVHWADDLEFVRTNLKQEWVTTLDEFEPGVDLYGSELISKDGAYVSANIRNTFFERALRLGDWSPLAEGTSVFKELKSVNPSFDPQHHNIDFVTNFFEQAARRITVNFEKRNAGEPFHRTRYLNQMLAKVDTRFVCIHDADIVYPATGIIRSLTHLREGISQFCLPFCHMSQGKGLVKVFVDDGGREVESATLLSCLTGDFSHIHMTTNFATFGAGYGGSVFANTVAYRSAGGENETLISWGAEDVERYARFIKLGYVVDRMDMCRMYHLEHPRGVDSGRKNPFFHNNEQAWEDQQLMSVEETAAFFHSLTGKKYGWDIMFGPEYKKDGDNA